MDKLDYTGKNPEFRVSNEEHLLSGDRNHYLVMAKQGTFFLDSLAIRASSVTGKQLILGVDYVPVLYSNSHIANTAMDVCAGIIIKTNVDKIYIGYQKTNLTNNQISDEIIERYKENPLLILSLDYDLLITPRRREDVDVSNHKENDANLGVVKTELTNMRDAFIAKFKG